MIDYQDVYFSPQHLKVYEVGDETRQGITERKSTEKDRDNNDIVSNSTGKQHKSPTRRDLFKKKCVGEYAIQKWHTMMMTMCMSMRKTDPIYGRNHVPVLFTDQVKFIKML